LEETEIPSAKERWRRLRGIGALGRRQLAAVRELFNWREETAERLNRPPRTIVRDDLLIEIAKRNPSRERDLQVIRGLPRRDLSAIVEVVQKARSLPLEQCPVLAERDQDPPQAGLLQNLLTAVLGDFCAREQLATNLVPANYDIKLLVRAHLQQSSPPAESILTQGWRVANVLPHLQAVLHGRRSVRVADVAADAPFAYDEQS